MAAKRAPSRSACFIVRLEAAALVVEHARAAPPRAARAAAAARCRAAASPRAAPGTRRSAARPPVRGSSEHQPLEPSGEADARRGRARPAPSPGRRSGRRRATLFCAPSAPLVHLERRAHVVVEPAHQPVAERYGMPSSSSSRRTSAKCSRHGAHRWSEIFGSASMSAGPAAPCSRARAAGSSRAPLAVGAQRRRDRPQRRRSVST